MLKFSRTTEIVSRAAAVLLCIGLAASCSRSDVASGPGHGSNRDGRIMLALGQRTQSVSGTKGTGSTAAPAAQSLSPVVLESRDVSLMFTPKVSRISDGLVPASVSESKGSFLTSANIITERDQDIAVTAYGMGADSTQAHVPAQLIKYSGSWYAQDKGMSNWEFPDSRSYHWPSTSALTFFAWTPASILTIADPGIRDHFTRATESGNVLFSYAMATPDGNNDFVNQPDVAFADTTMSWTTENGGRADLTFDHMLSAVSFEIGRTSAITVKSITLSNILSEGSCEYNPRDPVKPVDWTGVKTARTYTQEYNADIPQNPYDSSKPEGEDNHTLPIGDVAETAVFMVIPQKSGDAGSRIRLTVRFVTGESPEERTLSADLDESMANWLPGYKYTYVLSGLGNTLLIEVKDEMDGNVKKDLVISNTEMSDVKCFIRALIIGNWFEDKAEPGATEPVPGRILHPWTLSDGTFVPLLPTGTTPVNNWMLGDDGFYYYKYPVYPGTETGTGSDGKGTADKLFNTYTAPEGSILPGSFLKIDIVAQGVKWDDEKKLVSEAWKSTAGDDVINFLSATDKEE